MMGRTSSQVRLRGVVILAAALLVLACARGDRPGPSAADRAAAAERRAAAAELRGRLLGWVVVGDLDRVLASFVADIGGPGSPDAARLKGEIARALGAPAEIAGAVDSARPIVVGVVDPSGAPPQVLPVVVALPVRSRQALGDVLGEARPMIQGGPKGATMYQLASGARLYVSYGGQANRELAFLAFDPRAALGAASVLGPLATARPRAAIAARALVPNVTRRYGEQIDTLLTGFLSLNSSTSAGDPEVIYNMRHLRRAAEHLRSASAVELRLDPGPEGLTVALRMEGPKDGGFARYVGGQRPGPTWGVDLVPRDAMVFYSSHLDGASPRADARDLSAYLESLPGQAPGRREAREGALADLAEHLAGDVVYAIWPGADGGVGMGGAIRVRSAREARPRWQAAYTQLAPALGVAVARELGLDPAMYKFRTRTRRGPKLAGADVDLIEVTPDFPRGAGDERRALRWMFGERLVLGTSYVDDRIVWAAGRDWRPRLTAMVKAATGRRGGSLADAPGFARADALRQDGRVSLAYVGTAPLARFIAGALQGTDALAPEQQAMLEPFLGADAADQGIIMTTNVHVGADTAAYEVTSYLPLPTLARLSGLGGAMWRVGLNLLMAPPGVPPIPSPPRTLAPPTEAPAEPATPPSLDTPGPELPTGRGA